MNTSVRTALILLLRVKQSNSFPGLPAPCLHSRTVALSPSPGFIGEQHIVTSYATNTYLPRVTLYLTHSQTLTVGVLCEASCCRSGNGVHWMGSTGQLQTERSLAFPESNTPSPMLISLPLQPYWELQWIQRRKGLVRVTQALSLYVCMSMNQYLQIYIYTFVKIFFWETE